MTTLSLLVALLAGAATVLGLTSIVWVRVPHTPQRARRGGFLFLGIWMLLSLCAGAAICQQPRYIVPFCLVQGGLLIIMLWGEDRPQEERWG